MTSHGPATPSRSSPRSSPSLHWQACSRPGCGSHHGFHGKVAVTAHGSQDSNGSSPPAPTSFSTRSNWRPPRPTHWTGSSASPTTSNRTVDKHGSLVAAGSYRHLARSATHPKRRCAAAGAPSRTCIACIGASRTSPNGCTRRPPRRRPPDGGRRAAVGRGSGRTTGRAAGRMTAGPSCRFHCSVSLNGASELRVLNVVSVPDSHEPVGILSPAAIA